MNFPIVPHVNRTEITGLTKDGSYYTVDLTSFLQDTVDCKGVELQFVNTDTNDRVAGHRSTGASTAKQITVYHESHQMVIAKLDGSNQVDIMCATSHIDVYIQAEYHGDGIVLRDTDSYISQPNTPVGWKTETVQTLGGDSVGDVECAIAYGQKTGGSQPFALRAVGATNDYMSLIQYQMFGLPVLVNASGQYQTYIPSAGCGPPTVTCIEIGYIKKGYGFHGIFEPADESPSTNAGFEDMGMSGIVPKYTTSIVMKVHSNGGYTTRDASSVRANGSTNTSLDATGATWYIYYIKVDANRLIEYTYEGSQTVIFEVWGYQVDVPSGADANVLVLNTGTVYLDTGEIDFG